MAFLEFLISHSIAYIYIKLVVELQVGWGEFASPHIGMNIVVGNIIDGG